VGEEERRVLEQAAEPRLDQLLRRDLAQEDRDLPVLHELVGKPGVTARDLLGDQREGAHLGLGVEVEPAVFLGHAKGADADGLGAFEDARRQSVARAHVPFALPVRADEGRHHPVHEGPAAVAHQALILGQRAVVGVDHRFLPCHAPAARESCNRLRV
jgi:hypothetical protein